MVGKEAERFGALAAAGPGRGEGAMAGAPTRGEGRRRWPRRGRVRVRWSFAMLGSRPSMPELQRTLASRGRGEGESEEEGGVEDERREGETRLRERARHEEERGEEAVARRKTRWHTP